MIAEVSSHKHLGITISSDLNWSAHVMQLIKKVSRCCGLLRCMSHHLELPPQLSQVYFISTMFVNTALKNADWDQALNTDDIDAAFSTWTSIYLGMIKKLIPSKVVKQVKGTPPRSAILITVV